MSNTPSPLVILSGIFQMRPPNDALVHPSDGAAVPVGERIAHLVGRKVDVAVHHFPPGGQIEDSPGGGSCLLGASCKAGHLEDPAFLFSQKLWGTLSLDDTALMVDQVPIDFASLDGHYGRLVAFAIPDNQGASLGELLAEASSMAELLSSLRGTLKAST